MTTDTRTPITLTDSPKDIIVTMAEGNPGALTVIMALLEEDLAVGIIDLCHLDDMNMRGPQIWVGYKDHCGCKIEKFVEALRHRDKAMVETVNRVMGPQPFDHLARTSAPWGGSRD